MTKKCRLSLVIGFSCLLTTMPSLAAEFILTEGYYNETDDLNAIVQEEYGPFARVANWEEIKTSFFDQMACFLDTVGIGYNKSALLYRNDNDTGWWFGSSQHYFITRHNGNVPDYYSVHDHIDDHTVDLGSSYDIQLRILVKIIDDCIFLCPPPPPLDCKELPPPPIYTQEQLDQAREEAKQEGIKEVQNNPNNYELFTQTQIDAAKAAAFQEGKVIGVQEGIDKVKANPSDYGLFSQAQIDEAKVAAFQEGKVIGIQEGIDKVKTNPSDYDLFTQAQIDEAKAAAFQEGIKEVQKNPGKYGLFNQAQIDEAKAAAFQEGKVIGVQEGIKEVQNNPGKYGLFTQLQVEQAKAAGFQEGQLEVQNNPEKYGFFTQAQLDAAKKAGIQEGKLEVQNNPEKYKLFTQAQLDDAKETAFQKGVDEVTSNPSKYDLFTQTQLDDAKDEGIKEVQNNPGEYELFTQTQVKEAREEGEETGIKKVQKNPGDYGLTWKKDEDDPDDPKDCDGKVVSNLECDGKVVSNLEFIINEEVVGEELLLTPLFYLVGESLDVKLQEDLRVCNRYRDVDLWIAIEMPDGTRLFLVISELGIPSLISSPAPFKTNLHFGTNAHSVLSFVIPAGFGGEYHFYAGYTLPGKDLSDFLFTLRSNRAAAKVILSNS
jgi:hypothetical protein